MRLTDEDLTVLIEALAPGPDVETHSWGPSHAFEQDRWQKLYDKIQSERKRRSQAKKGA
jgi:hypothetical protein